MKSLVLERTKLLSLRDFQIEENLGSNDVRVEIKTVGICGSDVHYYQHGSIGPFIVKEPMILGHEAAGIIIEIGNSVKSLKVGDRVCIEPGVPDPNSRVTRLGQYNLDPNVRFWATPPVHGCLRSSVVHPAAFSFKLPENVSFGEGAMVEPLAVGMHAVNKAQIRPGDIGVVLGAGPIGTLTALSALAGGCSQIFITDIVQEKLNIISGYDGITGINIKSKNIVNSIKNVTDNWGADVVFDAVGIPDSISTALEILRPGGCLVLIGMPGKAVPLDVVAAQIKEIRIETIFRYAHVFPRALALMGSRAIDVKPLITDTFSFNDSIAAFEYAVDMKPSSVKIHIEL